MQLSGVGTGAAPGFDGLRHISHVSLILLASARSVTCRSPAESCFRAGHRWRLGVVRRSGRRAGL